MQTLVGILIGAALAAQCLIAKNVLADQVEVLWLGHATTRITSTSGKVIVIDPFLTKNPKAPARYRKLKALGKVDLILVTHGHPDHAMDLPALARLNNSTVVANWEFANNLVALGALDGDKVIAMNKGGTVEPLGRGIKIHMVPAEHSSSLDLVNLGWRNLEAKSPRYVDGGVAVGYIIELENGFKIYHTGDTWLFREMALIGELFKPDLALVCIGGHFTMGPEHAAYAIRKMIKPKKVLPIHYGTIPSINRKPSEFQKALGDTAVEVLDAMPGQALKF
ncbi:MAG: metal-dependent hydrolase [Hyphomicrobiaceae bacterium]